MAGSYYVKADTKLLLNIDSGDTADDSLLDALGLIADQHIDNKLKLHDERIPLVAANVLKDINSAANYYVASLFRGKRGDTENAKFWMDAHETIMIGIEDSLSIDGAPQVVERFTGRRYSGDSHYLAEW